MSRRGVQCVVWLGSLVLISTAMFHGSGWSGVAAAIDEAGVSADLATIVKALWLYPSYHWFFIAILAALAVLYHPSRLARLVLVLATALLLADVVLLLLSVGPFIGEALLAVSALAFVFGSLMLTPE